MQEGWPFRNKPPIKQETVVPAVECYARFMAAHRFRERRPLERGDIRWVGQEKIVGSATRVEPSEEVALKKRDAGGDAVGAGVGPRDLESPGRTIDGHDLALV
jgi:hypothetical protein